jgi:hypothetical protein
MFFVSLIATCATTNAAEVYFCPFADSVVRIEVDSGRVLLRHSLYPGDRFFEASEVSPNVWAFQEIVGSFAYSYTLDTNDGFGHLYNQRVDLDKGSERRQRGYCYRELH